MVNKLSRVLEETNYKGISDGIPASEYWALEKEKV